MPVLGRCGVLAQIPACCRAHYSTILCRDAWTSATLTLSAFGAWMVSCTGVNSTAYGGFTTIGFAGSDVLSYTLRVPQKECRDSHDRGSLREVRSASCNDSLHGKSCAELSRYGGDGSVPRGPCPKGEGMTEVQLGAQERAVLIVLMAASEEISTLDLERRYGLVLNQQIRRRLNELGFVVSRHQGRVLVHELTDRGWRYCREELFGGDSALPGTAGAALRAVLEKLGQFMVETGLTPAEIFGVGRQLISGEGGSLEATIRKAYSQLVHSPGDWVRLAELRPRLGPATVAQVDATLIDLYARHEVVLIPEANQKMLTAQDRTAAVRCGGEDKHLIAIGET